EAFEAVADARAASHIGVHAERAAALRQELHRRKEERTAPLEAAPGHAARIMTGAFIPMGVDAVIMREQTNEEAVTAEGTGVVTVLHAAKPGENIRRLGEDVSRGEPVGAAGDVVTPGRLNLLAATGQVTVEVHRRPRVCILASGDEIRELGQPFGPLDVLNSNAHAIAAAVRDAGAIAELIGIAADTLGDHIACIERARGADVLLTIGGVSVGTHDFVKPALTAVGATLELWKVAMRPGKPVAFGVWGRQLVFGLPGNPVSSQVSFELFVKPALLRLQGRSACMPQTLRARLVGSGMGKKAGFRMFARASAAVADDGYLEVCLDEKQGSGQVSGLARANALCVLAEEQTTIHPGDVVEVMLLDESWRLAAPYPSTRA
ncbi:MAG: gephyrin-like molybdotransferase Glp, partial [Myxococcota bacterium]